MQLLINEFPTPMLERKKFRGCMPLLLIAEKREIIILLIFKDMSCFWFHLFPQELSN